MSMESLENIQGKRNWVYLLYSIIMEPLWYVCLQGPKPMRVGMDMGWLPGEELVCGVKLGLSSRPLESAQIGIVGDALGYGPSRQDLCQV